jgi:RNA polymerase sigma factor (sigma-70 family)
VKSSDHTDKEEAFLRLLTAHKGMLYKICRLYQDREEDRQDLLQEIMAQLWVSWDSFRGESAFSSFLYRVALNTAIVYLKKGKQQSERFMYGHYPDLAEELRPVRDQEERLAIFYRAVAQLDKLEKALIFLYMEGHAGKDMAQILGVSHASVRVKLNRVKNKLQTIIKTMGYEF